MKLRELRISNNIYQAELGKILNVTGQTILNWENGIFEPKISQLILLAECFNVTIDYLVEKPTGNDVVVDLSGLNENEITHIKLIVDDFKKR